MACDALPGQTDKRSLAADDRRGMCAIYPPELAIPRLLQAGHVEPSPRTTTSAASLRPASRATAGLPGGSAWLAARCCGAGGRQLFGARLELIQPGLAQRLLALL
jgi:hypothetical protein